jgi:broad specificity phosphatase PhoE
MRARELLSHIEQTYAGAKVLAVSHGALIRFVLSEVSAGAIPPAGERLQNASLHILRHTDGWQLEAWQPQPHGSNPIQ